MPRQTRYIFLFFLLAWTTTQTFAGPPSHYPTPEETENRLFYLQRSTSKHTIIYDAKLLSNGELNPKKPVDAYWLRYNKKNEGKKRKLNFAEKKFAYGLSFKRKKNNVYAIKLKAYSGRDINVLINKAGKAVAHIDINNQAAILKSIYIDVSGSGFWLSVNSIELTGIAINNGELLTERFDPDEDED